MADVGWRWGPDGILYGDPMIIRKSTTYALRHMITKQSLSRTTRCKLRDVHRHRVGCRYDDEGGSGYSAVALATHDPFLASEGLGSDAWQSKAQRRWLIAPFIER